MRAVSITTIELDSYNAGRELGEGLAELQPDVVILFSSIHYDFQEQYEGLCDGLGTREVTVFGGTGDGFFETDSGAAIGVAALGINGEGAMRSHCHVEPGVSADSRAAGKRCAEALAAAAGDDAPRLALVMFDYLESSDNYVVEGINEVLGCPVFGGAASDDRKLERSFVLHNGQATKDAVGMLGLSGEFSFAVEVENGTLPVSEAGIVEAATGNTLERISGRNAMDFVAERLGRSADSFTDYDIGLISVQCSPNADMGDSQFRSVAKWHRDTGALDTFGPVEVGQHVRVAMPTSDDLIHGVEAVLERHERRAGFEPVAGLGVSCAGRKWLLGDRFDEEIQTIRKQRRALPVIGFPSLGEIAPRRREDGSYSANLFHNVSFVFALLGDPAPASPPA